MNFKTIKDLNMLINKNLHNIPNDVDLIVGVPRSGLFVASLLSLYLNLPVSDVDSMLNNSIFNRGKTKIKDNWIKSIDEARKILIVEDSSLSGKSLKELRKKLEKFKYKDRVIILTIYVTDVTKKLTDMFFEICNPPRSFEWNYMHNKNVINVCFDIDGVLCVDPTEKQNDDGDCYIDFILNAPVRFVPTYTIGYLVTTRLEKYRKETEEWLNKNGIKYNKLIMLNLNSKKERQALGNHGKFKGEVYKSIKKSTLFVESNYNQAIEIARISKKTVYCVETQEVIDANISNRIKTNIKWKIKKILFKIYRFFIKKV